ncbi:MAG: hypothetical protein EAY81_03900 [Bacteroidetes bacterium]|nr:MAG: hypothetical protein EAY81_03900 [Bacteroidota bacterium]
MACPRIACKHGEQEPLAITPTAASVVKFLAGNFRFTMLFLRGLIINAYAINTLAVAKTLVNML